jgi:hypothetical protein
LSKNIGYPENISKSYPAVPAFGKFVLNPALTFLGFLVLLMMEHLSFLPMASLKNHRRHLKRSFRSQKTEK